MIGATGTTAKATYYVLYAGGQLWAIGDNSNRQLGLSSTTTNPSNTWVQPQYGTNIAWISPQEHDGTYPFINVVTTSGKIYNWGAESGNAMGRNQGTATYGTNNNPVNVGPGEPAFAAGGNTGILAVESGGHTSMAIRQCESNFGYVGHYVRGSMGDGRAGGTDNSQNSFSFNTSAVQICGAESSEARIDAAPISTQYCNDMDVTLTGFPAGGTFSITSGASYATLSGDGDTRTLTFRGTGNREVVVTYSVPTSSCNPAYTSKTFVISSTCPARVTIPGKVWFDNNKNASIDNTPTDGTGTNNGGQLWANLVGPDGAVIQSVKVNSDGTFEIVVPKSDLTINSSDYNVIITNSHQDQGDQLTESDKPEGYGYTGTNRGGNSGNNGPQTGNKSGIINVGNLTTASTTTPLAPANFGITDDASLPITFGAINATIKGGSLLVSFTSETETNNDHFEIEGSADGKNFAVIGRVKSVAENGNSSTPLQYEFSHSINGGTMALGMGLLALGGIGIFANRKRRILFALVTAAGLSVFYMGCKKADNGAIENGKFFIRIAQVDLDGNKSYSDIITVVQE